MYVCMWLDVLSRIISRFLNTLLVRRASALQVSEQTAD
jgi:hypothetical protein